jgi:cytochrome oxidase Cu insertion factor (SCO1/SenC/PrrC family)
MGLIVLLLTSGCGAHQRAADPLAAAPTIGTPLDAPVPKSVLDAPLEDARGRPTTLGAWRGKVIVLSDVMTLCRESCPIITASMVAAARQLAGTPLADRVEFVSLTIDPRQDDRRHLRAYQRQFGTVPHWTLLTGSPRVVNNLWHRLGIWRHQTHLARPFPRDWVTGAALTTDIAHTDELIFIDAHQSFRYEMEGSGTARPGSIPARIYHFMDRLGHSNVSAPQPGSWTPAEVAQVLGWVLGAPG